MQKSAEQKIEYNWNNNTLTTTGTLTNLLNIAQGDTFADRQGNAIHTRYVDVNLQVFNPAMDSSFDSVLIALIHDKQPNATLPAFGDVYDLANTDQASNAFKNYQVYADRFTICWEKRLPNSTEGSIQVNAAQAYTKIRMFYKCPPKMTETRYAGAAAGVPVSGAYYLGFVCGSVTTTAQLLIGLLV